MIEFVELQNREPQLLRAFRQEYGFDLWWYKGKVLKFELSGPTWLREQADESLMVKHFVLCREKSIAKLLEKRC